MRNADHPFQRPVGSAVAAGDERELKAVAGLEPEGAPVRLDPEVSRGAGPQTEQEHAERLTEELRVIKRRLLRATLADSNPRGNVLMVASPAPGDGKSFMALSLARSIAADPDHQVVLIDGDFRKPHISAAFGLTEQSGFLDVLGGTATLCEVMHPTDHARLAVVGAGRPRENVNELLASRRAELLLTNRLANAPGKIIIFDSSPVLYASESQVLARLVGTVVLVVRAGATAQKALSMAIQELGPIGKCAVILNDADVVPLSSYYSRSYGYGRGD